MKIIECTKIPYAVRAVVSLDGDRYHFIIIADAKMTIIDEDGAHYDPEELDLPMAVLYHILGDDSPPVIAKYFRDRE